MTTDILLALALTASLILNAMQASKAVDWRNKLKHKDEVIDHLTLGKEDEEAVYLRDPKDAGLMPELHADWLSEHKGVEPKPGYERKRR